MNYVFEKVRASKTPEYQVRLNGCFVCYSDNKEPAEIDRLLQDAGYSSREHFLKVNYGM